MERKSNATKWQFSTRKTNATRWRSWNEIIFINAYSMNKNEVKIEERGK